MNRFLRGIGVAIVVCSPTGALAQSRPPVAVPIVGSPAAEQQPVPIPSQPPSVPAGQPQPYVPPGQPPYVPAGQPPAAVAAPPMAAQPVPQQSPATVAASRERKLELSIKDGTVALDAQNVTVRDILAEWQRRSGCQFVNAEKILGGPVTVQFPAGTPELSAIDSLLRGLATATTGYGYIVAPSANAVGCGAVYVLPISRPMAVGSIQQAPGSPIAAPLMMGGSIDDEIPPVTPFPPIAPGQPQRVPAYPGQPGQPQPNPNQPPTAPPASSSPGFGPIAPVAPGAGRTGPAPANPAPTPPAPSGGRGGQG